MLDLDRLTAYIIHDDRPDAWPGIALAIVGISIFEPGADIIVSYPNSAGFCTELPVPKDRLVHRDLRRVDATSFNLKPMVILEILAEGYRNVIWFDSDIIWRRPLPERLEALPEDILVATEETAMAQNQGSRLRTENWGLPLGRSLPRTINSGIVRATGKHTHLLQAWKHLLMHPLYREAQALPWYRRPPHMLGDQDVLTALLGSNIFSDVQLRLLRRGSDIAQCFGPSGFTVAERLRSLAHGAPPLIHAMGAKPWAVLATTGTGQRLGVAATYRRMAAELSPYARAAADLQKNLGMSATWSEPSLALSKVITTLSGRHIALSGLPLAAIDQTIRGLKRVAKFDRITYRDEFRLAHDPFTADWGD